MDFLLTVVFLSLKLIFIIYNLNLGCGKKQLEDENYSNVKL